MISLSFAYYICYSYYPFNTVIYLLIHILLLIYFIMLYSIYLSLTSSSSSSLLLRKTSIFLYFLWILFLINRTTLWIVFSIILLLLLYFIYHDYPLKNGISTVIIFLLIIIDYLSHTIQTTSILSISMELSYSVFYYLFLIPILSNPKVIIILFSILDS